MFEHAQCLSGFPVATACWRTAIESEALHGHMRCRILSMCAAEIVWGGGG